MLDDLVEGLIFQLNALVAIRRSEYRTGIVMIQVGGQSVAHLILQALHLSQRQHGVFIPTFSDYDNSVLQLFLSLPVLSCCSYFSPRRSRGQVKLDVQLLPGAQSCAKCRTLPIVYIDVQK